MFDVLAFPSTYEGLPLTAIEAQAEGLPIVLSTEITKEVSIISELLHPISLTESPKIWAQTLLSSADHAIDRENLDIKPLVAAGYGIQQSADSLCDWYESVVVR